MAGGFDYARFDKLYRELGSENKAFKAMQINRSTGQRALQKRGQGVARPPAIEVLPAQAHRTVDVPVPVVLDDLKGDLIEMVTWWRDRKLRQTQPRSTRETVRWTIHVDPRWRDRVMEISDAERSSITEVMDRMFRTYFERPL